MGNVAILIAGVFTGGFFGALGVILTTLRGTRDLLACCQREREHDAGVKAAMQERIDLQTAQTLKWRGLATNAERKADQLRSELLDATRFVGWNGVYTNAKGEEVPIVGLGGYMWKDHQYVIVEPTERPGITPYPVKRDAVRWE